MSHHGHIHWNELNTHDPEAAKAFYGRTLGWTFGESELPDGTRYTLIMMGEQMVGGMFHMIGDTFKDVPEHWFTYIAVDDIADRVQKVVDNGGTLTRPIFHVPETGQMAVIQAASGSYVALMQPEEGET